MVVKLSSFLSTSLADGLDSALVTGIIANTDVALDSGTTGNYIATITGGDGITVVDGAAHEAAAIVRVDSATVATADNTLTVTNKTFNLTNNTLTGTLGQFNAALNGSTFASLDGGETLTNKTLTSPTINTPQIVGPGSFSKVTTLGLRDQTTNAFDLRVFSNSSTALTDNRTLTVDVENVNRTVKLGGDLIIDKELRTAGDFNLLMNLTDSTNITLPTSGTVMQFDSNGASTITGAFAAGSLSGHYLGADSDVTELVTKAFVDNLGVDASTLGGRDSDYFLNYNNFTNTPAGSVALASLGVNAPSNPSNGQLWWDDSAGNLYVYYVDSDGDTQWVEAVPQLAAEEYFSTSGGDIAGSVTISNNGKLSINTSSTEATLNIADIGSTGPAVLISGGSNTEGDITVPHDENLQIGHWNAGTSTFTNRLHVKTDGFVGIGTNAPTAKLHVEVPDNTEFLKATITGNEAWAFKGASGSGSTDYASFGISGGTQAMAWQEDGKVGIGTNAPTKKLHVVGDLHAEPASGRAEAIFFNKNGETVGGTLNAYHDANGSAITLGNNYTLTAAGGHNRQDTSKGAWAINSDIRSASSSFNVAYVNTSNSWDKYFDIDASGRVSKPNQPGFSVRQAALNGINASGGYTLFTSLYETHFNTGSHFSTTNGRFTAPVAGKYMFASSVRYDQFGGNYFYTSMFHNGSTLVGRCLSSLTGTYLDQTITACVDMAANDYVYVYIVASGDTSVNIDPDTFFWGYKVG